MDRGAWRATVRGVAKTKRVTHTREDQQGWTRCAKARRQEGAGSEGLCTGLEEAWGPLEGVRGQGLRHGQRGWEAAGLTQLMACTPRFWISLRRPLLWTLCELDRMRSFATSVFHSALCLVTVVEAGW